jgi:hypothetical protein
MMRSQIFQAQYVYDAHTKRYRRSYFWFTESEQYNWPYHLELPVLHVSTWRLPVTWYKESRCVNAFLEAIEEGQYHLTPASKKGQIICGWPSHTFPCKTSPWDHKQLQLFSPCVLPRSKLLLEPNPWKKIVLLGRNMAVIGFQSALMHC